MFISCITDVYILKIYLNALPIFYTVYKRKQTIGGKMRDLCRLIQNGM